MQQTKTCISTRTKFFDFNDPWSYDYNAEELAHSLSNICRYTGHCSPFYSVAEHSVLVSRVVPPEYALEGLLHDASEAFCGDVSKPLKEMIGSVYKDIENEVQAAISHFFGIQYPYPPEVHKADGALYWAERKTVAKSKVFDVLWLQDIEAADVKPVGLSPVTAKREFLERFEELFDARHGPVFSEGTACPAARERYSPRLAVA